MLTKIRLYCRDEINGVSLFTAVVSTVCWEIRNVRDAWSSLLQQGWGININIIVLSHHSKTQQTSRPMQGTYLNNFLLSIHFVLVSDRCCWYWHNVEWTSSKHSGRYSLWLFLSHCIMNNPYTYWLNTNFSLQSFGPGELSYTFVIETDNGRALVHPQLPEPEAIQEEPVVIIISDLETSPGKSQCAWFVSASC